MAKLLPTDALFLDFDGTLAPLQDDPDAVFLAPEEREQLIQASIRLGGALAVLTGRDVRDLARRVPDSLWRLGNHGLYVAAPQQMISDNMIGPPDALHVAAVQLAASAPGLKLEVKGPVMALHYRQNPQEQDRLGEALRDLARDRKDYSLQSGKMIFELKPKGANKGEALRRAMTTLPFKGRRPVMIGDDTTDEDAMRAALALGGTAIKVGDGETSAPHRVATPKDVHRMIEELVHGNA